MSYTDYQAEAAGAASSMTLTRQQKSELAFEVMSAAVELVAARHEDGTLDESLKGESWETLSHQMAVWFKDLPGDKWYQGLPEVWK